MILERIRMQRYREILFRWILSFFIVNIFELIYLLNVNVSWRRSSCIFIQRANWWFFISTVEVLHQDIFGLPLSLILCILMLFKFEITLLFLLIISNNFTFIFKQCLYSWRMAFRNFLNIIALLIPVHDLVFSCFLLLTYSLKLFLLLLF